MALSPEDKQYLSSKFDPIEKDLHDHKAGVQELREYVKSNDAIAATKSMQTFMWFVGFILAVITFTVGTFFPLIFNMLYK